VANHSATAARRTKAQSSGSSTAKAKATTQSQTDFTKDSTSSVTRQVWRATAYSFIGSGHWDSVTPGYSRASSARITSITRTTILDTETGVNIQDFDSKSRIFGPAKVSHQQKGI
jgi:hypothetical protein